MFLYIFFQLVTESSVFLITSCARPTSSNQDTMHQKRAIGPRDSYDHMTTEAIIGVVGVVVAALRIVSSLAWSKRRKSCGQSRCSFSTLHGAQIQDYSTQ
jgi:hypothetical protein